MRNLLALIGAVVVVGGGLAWYRGWISLGKIESTSGKTSINLDINKDKAINDIKAGKDKVNQVIDDAAQRAAENQRSAAQPQNQEAPPGTPPLKSPFAPSTNKAPEWRPIQ